MSTGQGRDQEDEIRILDPKRVEAAGNMPKRISEFVGRLASSDSILSIARMESPAGWTEPPQTPEFDEFTVVVQGELHVLSHGRIWVVRAGQAIRVPRGIRVQYATPGPAVYIAVCLPAFSPDLVHREAP
ncbi:MAG TPA: cupin domain-containing protein [Anaeromyxobacteraceae bacterium]|nr:cupin domain-containing protein [Anaeromyxobacteraceae bacterium]